MRIERCLVDSGYQTDTVYAFCRQSHHAALLTPSKGLGIGAANVPFERWTKRPGETLGTHWALTSNTDKRAVRHVKIDVNWWKSFVAARLVTAVGDHGALTMFGKRGQDHAMLVDHLVSEKRIETSGQSRTLEEWRQKPNTQNHWWDCLVGAAAAASMQGTTMGEVTHAVKKKERVDFAALQAAARGR
jgi:phage terminase large subunit GpA-like protein